MPARPSPLPTPTRLQVGPPAGQRFSAAWLRGLSAFVAWRLQAQPLVQAQQPNLASQADEACVDQLAERQVNQQQHAAPTRLPVTVERLPASWSQGAEVDDGPGPSVSAAEGSHASDNSGVEEEADVLATHSGGSTPRSSASITSDLGWASVLAPAAAAASASASPGGSSGSAGAAVAAESQGIGGGGSRGWWPAAPTSLATAQPAEVEEEAAAAAAQVLPEGSRVQLSLRLERMALTDR